MSRETCSRGAVAGWWMTAALLACCLFAPRVLSAEGRVVEWDRGSSQMRVEARDWPLQSFLKRLAAQTGWQIYVEPGLDHPISVKFDGAPLGESLKMAFSPLNYAMPPAKDGRRKLLIFRAAASAATQLVQSGLEDKPDNWIADEILLKVDPKAGVDIEKLAAELGAKIVAKSGSGDAYRLKFDSSEEADAARSKLADVKGVSAQDNYSYKRPELPVAEAAGGTARLNLPPPSPNDPNRIKVALLDTAIQPLDGELKNYVLPEINVAGGESNPGNDPTHATSMAVRILSSLALTANSSDEGRVVIQPFNIYGAGESTSTFEVAEGLRAALQSNPQVINLSFGGSGYSPWVDELLLEASRRGIAVFAAAGNQPTGIPNFPASSQYAIGVTASDWQGNLASYANTGSFVDVKAPGSVVYYHNGQRYISTGTSTATAFISGQAAALRASGLSSEAALGAILDQFNIAKPAVPRAP